MSEVSILVIGAAVLAAIAYCAFWAGSKGESIQILGAICGGLAVFITAIFLAVCLITTGEEFLDVAKVAVAAHIPIVIIESIITGSVVAFLVKVKPEMLPIDKEDEKK
ncbi:MAG: energy-coupling factor ABC transporter permease [Methanosarcinales archaeon]|nr:energy-coupling factor ABC transporter permease [Methanosarcinales archaeon]